MIVRRARLLRNERKLSFETNYSFQLIRQKRMVPKEGENYFTL